MIHRDLRESVALVRVEHGKANVLDLDLCAELREELSELERSGAEAAILTGTGSIFSAGVDLFKVLDGGDGYIDRFMPALSALVIDLFTWPRPLVAAINGHAIAGGCIITAACDYRIVAEGTARVGVPELAVGVPFPTAPLEVLRFALAPHVLHELIYTGRTWHPADALARGLVDEIVSPELLIERSMETARRLASVPPASFQLTKRMLRRPTVERIRQSMPLADSEVANAWRSPSSHAAMRAHLEKTVRRSQ
jgi:enoyl-CoA hydratase